MQVKRSKGTLDFLQTFEELKLSKINIIWLAKIAKILISYDLISKNFKSILLLQTLIKSLLVVNIMKT